MDKRELYKTLELPFGAGKQEIKDAYRRLAKKYHPDITKDIQSGEKLAKIISAYKTLKVYAERKSVIDFPVKHAYKKQSARPHKTVDIFSLGKLLTEGKTVGMRAFAARALGNSGKKSAYAYLRKGLWDSEPLVVKSVVEAIGKLGINQSAGELGSVFAHGNEEVKLAVLGCVKKIGMHGAFRGIVLEGMRDGNPRVRKLALRLFAGSREGAS